MKGIGTVWQLTAIDTHTRFAVVRLITGNPDRNHTIRFVDEIRRAFRRVNIELRGVLTDNGPEWISRDFQDHLADTAITHQRTPPRSPDHKAVCERFQGICLQEFHRPLHSTANASTDSPTSTNNSRHGCTATTPADPTTATTCADAPPPNCSDNTKRPDEPPVNTNRDQDALVRTLSFR